MSETKPEKVCAFCDKKLSEVEQLVERRKGGPAICNECIAMSIDMLLKQLTRIMGLSNQRKDELEKARDQLSEIRNTISEGFECRMTYRQQNNLIISTLCEVLEITDPRQPKPNESEGGAE